MFSETADGGGLFPDEDAQEEPWLGVGWLWGVERDVCPAGTCVCALNGDHAGPGGVAYLGSECGPGILDAKVRADLHIDAGRGGDGFVQFKGESEARTGGGVWDDVGGGRRGDAYGYGGEWLIVDGVGEGVGRGEGGGGLEDGDEFVAFGIECAIAIGIMIERGAGDIFERRGAEEIFRSGAGELEAIRG